jgi:FMN phosphatase YigB (HAD superfamily)
MLNALLSPKATSPYKYIGFDLDGTIYDEFDFIVQAYGGIIYSLQNYMVDANGALNWMLKRWLELGSSYPHIFSEAWIKFSSEKAISKDQFISIAITIYRDFEPTLHLSKRAETILDACSECGNLFLLTDGNPKLQRRKFNALGLSQWFDDSSVIFSGDHQVQKPSIYLVPIVRRLVNTDLAIYCGDRSVDAEMAAVAGMQFSRVINMVDFG